MKIWDKIVEGMTRLAIGDRSSSLLGLTSPPADDGAPSRPAPDRPSRSASSRSAPRWRGSMARCRRRDRGVPRLLPGAAGRGGERPALLRSRQARCRRLRDLCAPGGGAVSRCAGDPGERARRSVQHRARPMGQIDAPEADYLAEGRAHLRSEQRALRARQGRGAGRHGVRALRRARHRSAGDRRADPRSLAAPGSRPTIPTS